MAREEYDWIDDAFRDEPKPADSPQEDGAPARVSEGYDWIDDAFNDAKEDPLARKGMTGCSSLAVLICSIAVLLILAFLAFMALNFTSFFDLGA